MDTREKRRPAQSRRPADTRRPPRRSSADRNGRRGAEAPRNAAPRQARTPESVRRQPARRPAPARKVKQERRAENSKIVYTDPKPFNGRKLLLQLATVVAVVLAVLFGMSIFFKVDLNKATVAGNVKYSVNDVMAASGIRGGSNLLTLSDAQVSGNIKAKLPYVKSVRVGIKLPDTVNIEIKELDVSYSVEGNDGGWWLMGADGRIVDQVSMSEAKTYTQILGMKIQDAVIGEQAVACEPEVTEETTAPDDTDKKENQPDKEGQQDGSEPVQSAPAPQESMAAAQVAPVKLTGAEQMHIVLSVLKNLEVNGIIGTVASINVSDPTALELWYGSRYQVNLGNTQNLEYKISMLKAAVKQMGTHQSGQLDVSFTTWPNQVGYTPFA